MTVPFSGAGGKIRRRAHAQQLRLATVCSLAWVVFACGGDGNATATRPTVSLQPSTIVLEVGAQARLATSVGLLGGSAADSIVTWWSSNPASVAVSPSNVPFEGVVTGNAPGQSIVTASVRGASASATVSVGGVTSVTLSKSSLGLAAGESSTLSADVTAYRPIATMSWPLRWLSSSPLVATVDSLGVVTGRALGKTRIGVSTGTASTSIIATVTGPGLTIVMLTPDSAKGTIQSDGFGYELLCKFPLTMSASGVGSALWWNFETSRNGGTWTNAGSFFQLAQFYGLAAGESRPTIPVWPMSLPATSANMLSRFTYGLRVHYSVNAEGVDYNSGLADDHVVEHTYVCLP